MKRFGMALAAVMAAVVLNAVGAVDGENCFVGSFDTNRTCSATIQSTEMPSMLGLGLAECVQPGSILVFDSLNFVWEEASIQSFSSFPVGLFIVVQ